MKGWTFITHHAAVLVLLADQPRMTALDIAGKVGITERSVRMIIGDLEREGYIEKIREGRGMRYTVRTDRPLRHPTLKQKSVGQFLALMGQNLPLPDKDCTV
ncbi:MAG: helix-turn-helix transcriptional regulator [Syntrophales bacterium]